MSHADSRVFSIGFIAIGRVNGDLAVSRALGDFSFKDRPDLPQQAQKITCDPDITIHERSDGDGETGTMLDRTFLPHLIYVEMLLVACDGLWDVFSSEEAIQVMREIYQQGERDDALVAEELLDLALHKGIRYAIINGLIAL